MNPELFTCAYCLGTFEKGWTDEEAEAEMKMVFPRFKAEDCAQVCDKCYAELTGESEH